MNPVIAMLLGVLIAGETVTPFEWAAVSVVLAGVLLLLWRQPDRSTPSEPKNIGCTEVH